MTMNVMTSAPTPDLAVLLWLGSAGIGWLLLMAWKPDPRSTGLPLCYLFSLGAIHFVGAWISMLPRGPAEDPTAVTLGFRECVVGVLVFAAAASLMESCLRGADRRRSQLVREPAGFKGLGSRPILGRRGIHNDSRRVRVIYLGLGALCGATAPLVRGVPGLSAMVHSGSYLVVAGCCLGCYECFHAGRRFRMLGWVAASGVCPVFTMFSSGFLGYGVFAVLMVLCFGLVHYRPRWHAGLGLVVLGYLGLSLYVTYMRERDNLREAVWGGQPALARISVLSRIFTEFEWFTPADSRQLQSIDDRLNQNYLVGVAYANLEAGLLPWAGGQTFWRAGQALIPRLFWPDKPVVAGSGNLVSAYTGIPFAEGTSVGLGQVLEFYIGFGRPGVVLGFFLLGLIVKGLDWKAARCLEAADPVGFAFWYLPGISFMQTGGTVAEICGTFAASLVLVFVVNRCVLPWMGGDGIGGAEQEKETGKKSARLHKLKTWGTSLPARAGPRRCHCDRGV
jgi:hypothetical protein